MKRKLSIVLILIILLLGLIIKCSLFSDKKLGSNVMSKESDKKRGEEIKDTLVGALFPGDKSDPNQDPNNPYIIAKIPSDIGEKRILKVKAAKCALKYMWRDYNRGPDTFDSLRLLYPMYAFSGNVNNDYPCKKDYDLMNDKNIDFSLMNRAGGFYIDAIGDGSDAKKALELTYIDNKGIKRVYPYKFLQSYIMERVGEGRYKMPALLINKDNIEIYESSFPFPANLIIIKGNSKIKHKVAFILYKTIPNEDTGAGLYALDYIPKHYYYDYIEVVSLLDDQFLVRYDIYASRDKTREEYNKSFDAVRSYEVDNSFIDEFFKKVHKPEDIIKNKEVLDKLIENNERVVKYIKSISSF